MVRSEDNLAAKLEDASWSCGGNPTEDDIINVLVYCGTYGGVGQWVNSVLRVVEDVECLRAELETQSFSESKIFAYTHIPVVDARAAYHVATAVAELACERLGKTRGIKPLGDTLVESVAAARIATGY